MKENNKFYDDISPTLSIIIPAYNVEDYITEALDSIFNQSQLPDEIIVINDGSTDNTSDVIKTHPLYKTINLIEIANKGQGQARNIGVSKASSDYIYFFDSDDLLVDNFVQQVKNEIIENQHPDLFFFSGESFEDSRFTGKKSFSNYVRNFEGYFDNQQDFLEVLLQGPELSCSPCLYISRRSIWISNELEFNPFYHEDEELLYPLIFSASSYLVSKNIYFLRRIRSNSTMTQSKSEKHELGLEALLKSLLVLLDNNKSYNLRVNLIRRRLGAFCLSYLMVSKQVSGNVNYELLLTATLQSRNVKTPLAILKHMVKKNAKKTVFNNKLFK